MVQAPQKITIEHCSRFWPVVENVRSYIVHASGTTCLKSLKTAKKLIQGPQKIMIVHDRTLFTLLAGRRKFTIVHCSRFWDHMFKITQNRKKSGLGVRQIIIDFSESPEVSKIITRSFAMMRLWFLI